MPHLGAISGESLSAALWMVHPLTTVTRPSGGNGGGGWGIGVPPAPPTGRLCGGAGTAGPVRTRQEAAMTQDPDIPHLDPAPGADHAADVTGLTEEILHRPVDLDVDAHPSEPVHEAVSGQVWFEQAAHGLCAP